MTVEQNKIGILSLGKHLAARWIFQRFYHFKSTKNKTKKLQSLGLSVCRKTLNSMSWNQNVWVLPPREPSHKMEASHETMSSQLLPQKARGWWLPDPPLSTWPVLQVTEETERRTHTGHHLCEGWSKEIQMGFIAKGKIFCLEILSEWF